MEDDRAARVYGDPLARWFVTEAFRITDTAALVTAASEQLVAAGIPLFRLAYFQLTLHPELMGKAYTWRRGRGCSVATGPHSMWRDAQYLDNPLPAVFEQRRTIRTRLEQRDDLQAPLLRDLKEQGATDYVALPLVFSSGEVHALSVVSDRPGGFATADLDRMYLLQFAFARLVEVQSLRDTAINLLDAYVGHAAGQRILAGEVKRGDGRTIEAVIWYCDLRGFTRTSDRLPRDAVVAMLNEYFGAMAEAVTQAKGEILKFMGDAMLAILPIGGEAERACAAIAALNDRRAAAAAPLLRFGLALHVGEVMFGNIGASARLDFTVIGPAVNHAARLEKLCGALDRPVLLSAALAALLPPDRVTPLGAHRLRDVETPQAIFVPAAG